MVRTTWADRKFQFDIPEGWMTNILERLRGATARMNELTTGLKDQEGNLKSCGDWSVKEHIGHLSDLEDLHLGRLDDYANKLEAFRPADMDNKKTNHANHNSKDIGSLIKNFSSNREKLISRFANLDPAMQSRLSTHPRLKVKMKPVDMAYFICEHDDHHIATMRAIVKEVKKM